MSKDASVLIKVLPLLRASNKSSQKNQPPTIPTSQRPQNSYQ
jgi:hypothetical protein